MRNHKVGLSPKLKIKIFAYPIYISYPIVISFLLLFCIIVGSPIIDPFIANIPYDKISARFYGENHIWCLVIYNMVPIITTTLVLGSSFIILLSIKYKFLLRFKRLAIIVLMSLVLGPGIIVNVIFKENWGRARPYQVLRDGSAFSPVWKAHFGAHKYNSFPSGHAAIGFFIGVPFLVAKRRKIALAVGVTSGGIVGAVRIFQGGHYLTDVVLSGFIVWLTTELVIYIMDNILRSTRINLNGYN